MSLSAHPKAYGSAALAVAFVAGILLTLGWKDLYPDLERRYQHGRRLRGSTASSRPSSSHLAPLKLEDHTRSARLSIIGQPITHSPEGVEGLIGNTPLVLIKSLSEATGRLIYGKAEFLNGAGGSPKDRVALSIIRDGEESKLLVPHRGDTIYEGSVGSTGISIASLARAMGYKAYICMPNDQAAEKAELLHHLGAEVEQVDPAPIADQAHFVNLARRRAEEHERRLGDGSKGFFANQFETGANWRAHLRGTGPEIWEQTGGLIQAFVAGAGTGGTISGVAMFLKQEMGLGKRVKVALADPEGSGLYNKIKHGVMFSSTEREGTRRRQQIDTIVEGIGINRTTENFEVGRDLIDDAVKVTDLQAMKMARWLMEKDGIFVGSSSAVNCVAAVALALQMPKESRIVTVLCDSGTRHLSKFWKKVGEQGLEKEHDEVDLTKLLGFTSYAPA